MKTREQKLHEIECDINSHKKPITWIISELKKAWDREWILESVLAGIGSVSADSVVAKVRAMRAETEGDECETS